MPLKEIVVISGKGGTGKTSLVACFAALAEKPVLADCDVDAADLHLILCPAIKETHDFIGGKQASVRPEDCAGCAKCEQVCRFGAVSLSGPGNDFVGKTYAIDPLACEGCGVCAWFCPAQAIDFKPTINGHWFISATRFGPLVHAQLGIAQENSGKLVTLVRKNARRIAEAQNAQYIIVDGSPGIGCPVIASLTGADLAVIVTEPTLSGRHDLARVAELAAHFHIPAAVCVNKYDMNPEMAERILMESAARGMQILENIPYDTAFTRAQVARQAVVEYGCGPVADKIRQLWRNITHALAQN